MDNMLSHNVKYLHISASSRKMYSISPDFFSVNGNIVIAGFAQARILSELINNKRRTDGRTDFTTPGIINAAALLHELFHFLIEKYEATENPGVLERAYKLIQSTQNVNPERLLLNYIEQFPPKQVLLGQLTPTEYLKSQTGLKQNSEIILEEMLLLYFENINPALTGIKELFDDSNLRQNEDYLTAIETSKKFLKDEKPFGAKGLSLFEFLQMPLIAHPDSIDMQLKYILDVWGIELLDILKGRILSSTDLIYEDAKLFIQHGGKGGSLPAPEYKTLSLKEINFLKEQIAKGIQPVGLDEMTYSYYFEPEQFTEDLDWMPKVVMIAKNIFVWLDQLSKKYNRPITMLHEIPDIELDVLSQYNFNALWLIGVWERSSASKKIKQFCGNHDAVASAYSLYDYEIAAALGGQSSFENLKYRCQARGIRMASDMVPNHTGIYSRCLMENPDYFIQTPVPPYPGYSFSGPDLSENPAFQIRIEDKYYTKNDAAVVFELKENNTGRVRYIYHGNDGTNMPWNDTAQFNLLNPNVRDYLAHQIKKVAAMFPIIRFDAAMTLTNKHYQRLWFPQPGLGGAIPSRAEYSLTRDTYNTMMPTEFWRDVVDNMTIEMPNTLLLAEAFWLMEGYFVRSLGMHRVYNSAFMHMFMKEENGAFKKLIKNTLEYNPEILKRYVNFMSNPDEETAVNQFGKGDKYFGVCAMLVTLPGLPMFAHGQVEGFTEKYGMEYQRAYYNETPDEYLIDRHKKEIFPLMVKRYLFSEVKNFWFYDFIKEDGSVDDNVIAYSNSNGAERTLVIFNNSYAQSFGSIKDTTARIKGDAQSTEESEFEFNSIGKALGAEAKDNLFYICYESSKHLEHLFSAASLLNDGFSCKLNGYAYKVFHSFKERYDVDGSLKNLFDELQGEGIWSVEEALWERKARGLHNRLLLMLSTNELARLREFSFSPAEKTDAQLESELDILVHEFSNSYDELKILHENLLPKQTVLNDLKLDLLSFRTMNTIVARDTEKKKSGFIADLFLLKGLIYETDNFVYKDLSLVFLMFNRMLTSIIPAEGESIVTIYKRLHLSKQIWQNLIRLNSNYQIVKTEFELLLTLIAESSVKSKIYHMPDLGKQEVSPRGRQTLSVNYLTNILDISEIQLFLGYNLYNGIEYFSKERFEQLMKWNLLLSVYDNCKDEIAKRKITGAPSSDIERAVKSRVLKTEINNLLEWANELLSLSQKSGFQFKTLKESIALVKTNEAKISGSRTDKSDTKAKAVTVKQLKKAKAVKPKSVSVKTANAKKSVKKKDK